MSEANKNCPESVILMDKCSVKNNKDSSETSTLPSGDSLNNILEAGTLKPLVAVSTETEPCERKKKTRRGKSKRKNPYSKDTSGSRKSVTVSKSRPSPRFAHRHADAPYNTNEFLMEDHNAFVHINSPPKAPNVNASTARSPRIRDNSFTSVESDDDHFYSSPEDEEEFLTKEFSNTYQDLHVETLQAMSKSELIQQVLQLEERVDGLENRCSSRKADKDQFEKINTSVDEECDKVGVQMDVKQFQLEIGRLRLENEKLQIENDRLRRRNRSSSVSSVDSESDSTTSSPSSVSDLSDKEDIIESNMIDDTDSSRSKEVLEESNMDVGMEEKNNDPV